MLTTERDIRCQVPYLRWMIRRDLPTVLEIESRSFEFPLVEEDFFKILRQRNCIGMVAEIDEQVVGYMIYELHSTRLNLLNFAVHPDYRRRGVGSEMMRKLVGKISASFGRRNRITADVWDANTAMHLFLRHCGFVATQVVHDAFQDPSGEDAYRFVFSAE